MIGGEQRIGAHLEISPRAHQQQTPDQTNLLHLSRGILGEICASEQWGEGRTQGEYSTEQTKGDAARHIDPLYASCTGAAPSPVSVEIAQDLDEGSTEVGQTHTLQPSKGREAGNGARPHQEHEEPSLPLDHFPFACRGCEQIPGYEKGEEKQQRKCGEVRRPYIHVDHPHMPPTRVDDEGEHRYEDDESEGEVRIPR